MSAGEVISAILVGIVAALLVGLLFARRPESFVPSYVGRCAQ